MPYYAEIMTGYEYSAAVLMLGYGMVDQGVECIANIRRRYDGLRANPYDETEYGRHYARAMASWAAIPVLSGFRLDARKQRLSLLPRHAVAGADQTFRSVWSTPTAWGNFAVGPRAAVITPIDGGLKLRELVLPAAFKSGRITAGGLHVAAVAQAEGQDVVLRFAAPVDITPATPLQVTA